MSLLLLLRALLGRQDFPQARASVEIKAIRRFMTRGLRPTLGDIGLVRIRDVGIHCIALESPRTPGVRVDGAFWAPVGTLYPSRLGDVIGLMVVFPSPDLPPSVRLRLTDARGRARAFEVRRLSGTSYFIDPALPGTVRWSSPPPPCDVASEDATRWTGGFVDTIHTGVRFYRLAASRQLGVSLVTRRASHASKP